MLQLVIIGYGFLAVLVWNRVSILASLVWNRVWFVHFSLDWACFLKEATSSSLLIIPSTKVLLKLCSNHVHAAMACHTLRSRARLLGFFNWSWPERSEIGYQIFYQGWNRVGKIADFGLKFFGVRVLGSRPHTPTLGLLAIYCTCNLLKTPFILVLSV